MVEVIRSDGHFKWRSLFVEVTVTSSSDEEMVEANDIQELKKKSFGKILGWKVGFVSSLFSYYGVIFKS